MHLGLLHQYSIDHTIPSHMKQIDTAPVQAICTVLIIMPVHVCTYTPEYILDREKNKTKDIKSVYNV